MIRRAVPFVLLGLVVVLAGCSAFGGGPGDGAVQAAGAAADGTGDGGDVTLVENRTAALRDAGSYTAVWTMEFARDGESVGATTYTHAVDYRTEQSRFEMLVTGDDGVETDYETYHADGTHYVRYGTDDEATSQVTDAPFAPENAMFSVQSYVTDGDDLAAFSAVGTETVDGVTVTRYERTDRPAWIAAQGTDGEFTWTEFTYAVLVDEDGLVRSERWGGEGVDDEGRSQTMTFSYSLSAVGSTDVEEPDWAASARTQAGR